MATSAAAVKAPAKAPAEPPAEAPKKKGKLLLTVSLVLVLLAAGAGGAWWFLGHSESEDDEVQQVEARPSIFLPLEQFTVNLQPEEGQQFLQTSVTLKLTEQDVVDALKAQMPEVRNRLLFLLSSKKPSEVGSTEGKSKLIDEIAREVEAVLPPMKAKAKKKAAADEEAKAGKKGKSKAKAKAKEEPAEAEAQQRRVVGVFFTHFIVQ
jgi:flagellar FliL protein